MALVDIQTQINLITNATNVGENTAARVGGAMNDILGYSASEIADIKSKLGEGTTLNPTFVQGFISSSTGLFASTSNPLYVSNYIPVVEGQKYAIVGVSGYSSILTIAMFAANDGTAANLTKSVKGNGAVYTDSELTIPNGINYLRLGYNAGIDADAPIISLLGNSVFASKAELAVEQGRILALETASSTYKTKTEAATDKAQLQTEIDALASAIGSASPIALTWDYGFVKHSTGALTTASATSPYRYSNMVAVMQGEKYIVSNVSGSSSTNVISMYTNDMSVADISLSTAGDNNEHDYTITIPSGVTYIRIGYNTGMSSIAATLTKKTEGTLATKTEVQAVNTSLQTQIDNINVLSAVKYPAVSPRKATIIFQMDWGNHAGTNYEAYDDKLKEYGVNKATYLILPEYLSQDTDVQAIIKARGNEIGLHTDHDHLIQPTDPTVTSTQLLTYLADWFGQMNTAGYKDLPGCVCLSAKIQEDLVQTMRDTFAWFIGVSSGAQDYTASANNYINALNTTMTDPQRPKRLGLELTPAAVLNGDESAVIANAKTIIDAAVAQSGMVIFYGHFYDDSSKSYCITENVLTSILTYLQPLIIAKRVVCGGTTEMLNYYFTPRVFE